MNAQQAHSLSSDSETRPGSAPSGRLGLLIAVLHGTRLPELHSRNQDSFARRRAHDRTERISQRHRVPSQVLLQEPPRNRLSVRPRGDTQLEHAQAPHRQQRRDPWLPYVQPQALPTEQPGGGVGGPGEAAEVNAEMKLLEAAAGGDAGPEEGPEVVVVGVRVDGGLVLLAGHGLPDGCPLDGEATDGAQAVRVDGLGEGHEGVQIVDIEDQGGVGKVGSLGVDGTAGAQEGERAVAQHVGEGGVGVRVEPAVGMAVMGPCSRSPASWGNRATESVTIEGGGGMLAAHMADLALELNQMNCLVAKDVVVDDQADLCGQFAEERRGRLGVDGTIVRVHWSK